MSFNIEKLSVHLKHQTEKVLKQFITLLTIIRFGADVRSRQKICSKYKIQIEKRSFHPEDGNSHTIGNFCQCYDDSRPEFWSILRDFTSRQQRQSLTTGFLACGVVCGVVCSVLVLCSDNQTGVGSITAVDSIL